MNSIRSINLSLKYQKLQHQIKKILGLENFEFMAKSQLLWARSVQPFLHLLDANIQAE